MNDEKVTRLNINLNEETANNLREMANAEGRTVTDIIRRAIGVYKFVAYDEAGDLYIHREDGERLRVMIL